MSDDRVKPNVEHVEATQASREFGEELGRLVPRLASRRHRGVARQDGMDLAQEGACRALEGLPGCADPERVGAYVVAVVLRLVPDIGRRNGRLPIADEPAAVDLVPWTGAPPVEIAVMEETRELVQRALAGLPPAYRQALEWRYWKGLTVKECAARARCNVPAMKSLLWRAQVAATQELRSAAPSRRRR